MRPQLNTTQSGGQHLGMQMFGGEIQLSKSSQNNYRQCIESKSRMLFWLRL